MSDNFYLVLGIIAFGLMLVLPIWGIWIVIRNIGNLIGMITRAVSGADVQEDPPPRSLSGYEPTLVPLIRKDFPDFDPVIAKNKVRDYVNQQMKGRKNLEIHNVVISQYFTDTLQKTIVFQAAVGWEERRKVEKRFEIHSSYLLPETGSIQAVNCPNCGATVGFGQVQCEYCGSRLVNPLSQQWKFTQMQEC